MAGLIADKKKTLKQLVEIIKSNPSQVIELSSKASQSNSNSLIQTMMVVTEDVLRSDPKTMKLFFLIGLLEDRIPLDELQKFWLYCKETHNIYEICDTLAKSSLIKLESDASGKMFVEMPKSVQTYAGLLHSQGQRQKLLDMIVNSHLRLMEHFYLNHMTEKGQVCIDAMYAEALELLLPSKNKFGLDSSLINTIRLIKDNLVKGE